MESDKKKVIAIIIFLLLFLAVSLFFCLHYKWWCIFLPSVILLFIEISLRLWRARIAHIKTLYKKGNQLKTFCLNSRNWLRLQGTKVTQSSNATAKTAMHGGQLNTQTQKSPLAFISAIKDLKLTDYIKGITGDLRPIILNPKEMYTEAEIESTAAAWLLLRSEYEICRKDRREGDHRKIVAKKTELELRKTMIAMLTESLKLIYSPILCDKLRFYYPAMQLTKETYLQDMKIIGNMEVSNRMHYEELKKMLDKDVRQSSHNQTTEEAFHSYINAYNRAFKTTFSIRLLFTDEYAYMCADYDKYVADLKKEYDKTRSKR